MRLAADSAAGAQNAATSFHSGLTDGGRRGGGGMAGGEVGKSAGQRPSGGGQRGRFPPPQSPVPEHHPGQACHQDAIHGDGERAGMRRPQWRPQDVTAGHDDGDGRPERGAVCRPRAPYGGGQGGNWENHGHCQLQMLPAEC